MTIRSLTLPATFGLMAILLYGCVSPPSNVRPIEEPKDSLENPSSGELSSSESQLQRVITHIQAQEYELAKATLATINVSKFTSQAAQAQYYLLNLDVAVHYQNAQEASYWVEQTTQTMIAQLPESQQIHFSLLRSDTYALNGEYLASARERIFQAPLLIGDQAEANKEIIWQTLLQVPTEQLNLVKGSASPAEYKGWLQLAALTKSNQNDMDRQVAELNRWQEQNPSHPAAISLPGSLALLQQFASERPKKITVVLPLQGRLAATGKAIRDGFLAAHFSTLNQQTESPEITLVDSTTVNNFTDFVWEQAALGTELIIGPLNKRAVQQLHNTDELPIPTLALNYIDNSVEAPMNLFQFGLSAEDEAVQVANQAWLDGLRKAAVIAPSSAWGQRVVKAFEAYWTELGGEVAETQYFQGNNDYSNKIRYLLNVDESEARAKKLKGIIGRGFEFNARRRQDIDWIFMLGNANQARQLKPTFAFHYAGKLPVYSTSNVFTGIVQTTKDRDLNGVKFCDIPWLHGATSPLKQQIHQFWKNASNGYDRLYALGIDAYQLYPRLQQLSVFPQSRLFGVTGDLEMDKQRKVHRNLMWVEMKGGRPHPIVPENKVTNASESNSSLNVSSNTNHTPKS